MPHMTDKHEHREFILSMGVIVIGFDIRTGGRATFACIYVLERYPKGRLHMLNMARM